MVLKVAQLLVLNEPWVKVRYDNVSPPEAVAALALMVNTAGDQRIVAVCDVVGFGFEAEDDGYCVPLRVWLENSEGIMQRVAIEVAKRNGD